MARDRMSKVENTVCNFSSLPNMRKHNAYC